MEFDSKAQRFGVYVLVFVVCIFAGAQLSPRIKQVFNDIFSNEQVVEDQTANTNAKLTPAGDPLPSYLNIDTRAELSYLDDDQILAKTILEQDTNGNWRLQLTDEDGANISLIRFDNKYYSFDNALDGWAEVPQSFADELVDINSIIFDQERLNNFNSQAVQLENEICGDDICSVWEAGDEVQGTDITIFVTKRTRRIRNVLGLDENGIYSIEYSYLDVNIEAPKVE